VKIVGLIHATALLLSLSIFCLRGVYYSNAVCCSFLIMCVCGKGAIQVKRGKQQEQAEEKKRKEELQHPPPPQKKKSK
jgi:hypothetical protein